MKRQTNIYLTLICIFYVLLVEVFPQEDLATLTVEEIEVFAKQKAKIWEKESLVSSVKAFQIASKKRIAEDNFSKAAENYLSKGNLYLILAEKRNAESSFNKSIQLAKRNNIYAIQARAFGELALLEIEKGDLDKCRSLIEEAERLDSLSGNERTKAFISFANSEYFYVKRDIPKSISFLKKAIQLAQSNNFEEDEARYLLNLGYAFIALDDIKNTFETLNKALEKQKLTNNLRGIAFTHTALGYAFSNYREKHRSIELYKAAEKMFPLDLDFDEKARVLNGIGRNYEDFGDWKTSLDYRKEAFALFEKTNNVTGKVATLTNIAVLQSLLQNKDDELVVNSFNQALKIAESANNLFFRSLIEEELGSYYFRLGNFTEAFENLNKSLLYFRTLKEIRRIPAIKAKMSQILISRKKFVDARENLLESLALNEIISDKFAKSDDFFLLAKLEHLENKPQEALNHITESINLTETLYSGVANSNLKRSYFSNVYDRYELYIHLLMQQNKQSPNENFGIQALQANEKSRSRSLLETLRLSEANFTKDANPELVQKEKELLNLLSLKTNKITELLSSNAERTEIDKVDEERRTLENELETVKADLKQSSPVYSAIKNPPPFDVAEFQKNILDDKTVLLEFSLGERESYLWLVSNYEVLSYVLPPRNQIEARIDKIHQSFEKRQSQPNETIEVYQQRMIAAENEFHLESKLLSQELLGPVIDKLQEKRLIIVPDGKLALLPLSALNVPDSDEPLILRNEIVYQPSASLLNILANLQFQKHLPSKDLLIFADPVFSKTDNRLNLQDSSNDETSTSILGLNLRDFRLMDENGTIPRLFATQDEADSIANVMGKSRTVIASGFDANRDRAINSDIADYRILHFATHGLVDVKRPEISSIVLSQFDKNGSKTEGFLRLQDIYALNLASDLVVLSACQSGVGKEIKGEGLMSLNNAFLQAGAKTVLSSAWKVDDSATAELMKHFYSNLNEKSLPPAQALREAQLKLRQNPQFTSPFYWAAFTIQGEFRQPIFIKGNNLFYYAAFFALVILTAGLAWRLRRR